MPASLRLLLLSALPLLVLPGCVTKDSDGGGAPADTGPGDAGPDADAWTPVEWDSGVRCPYYRRPHCNPQAIPPSVPYREGQGCKGDDQCNQEAGETCDRGINECRDTEGCLLPWACYECPRDPAITCAAPLTPQPDRYGCISAESECGCSITVPPNCPEGEVPHEACAPDGRRCYSGTCVEHRCDCVAPPDCPRHLVQERDEHGCITGRCVAPKCPDVVPPECDCDHRPARSPHGCLLGVCELEPLPCDPISVPVCPHGQVPETHEATHCLTGECDVGFCTNYCDVDQDCHTADACMPYGADCNTCQPRACEVDLDCPPRSDCVAGRCRRRPAATCERDEDCEQPLTCDDPGCGKCALPCECRAHDDCPPDTRCDDCACVAGCRTDDDCDPGVGCDPETGACRACACESDAVCPPDRYCNGCFCLLGCRESTQCPPWTACSPVTHGCEPVIECSEDFECGQRRLCVDDTCIDDPGICLDGRTVCQVGWDWRMPDYVCLKDTEAIPACPGADLNPPDPRCSPGEDDLPAACICDLDQCIEALCDGPRELHCPAPPYHCAKLNPDDPTQEGICREGRPEARRLCREEGECVPEQCEVSTFCVNSVDPSCQTRITTQVDRPEIVACSCVAGVCRTGYAF